MIVYSKNSVICFPFGIMLWFVLAVDFDQPRKYGALQSFSSMRQCVICDRS